MNIYIKLTVTFILSVLSVVVLYFFSVRYYNKNNFIRNIQPHSVKFIKKLNVKYNSYYIAGKSGNFLYFGNKTASLLILKTNELLTDSQYITLDKSVLNNYKLRSQQLTIDSPFFYITSGSYPLILKGTLLNWKYQPLLEDTNRFSSAYPIGDHTFVAKAINSQSKENIIKKWEPGKKAITPLENILTKQIDGLFCTDGQLQYDIASKELVYTYYYRNQFISLDTNLNILQIGRTIDTNTVAKIKVEKYTSGNAFSSLASPPSIVNKRFCVHNGWLFINSNLMANNEEKKIFDRSNVIDVYNLKEKRYKFSFYIPTKHKSDLKDFKVFGNRMVVINDQEIETYLLRKEYFLNN